MSVKHVDLRREGRKQGKEFAGFKRFLVNAAVIAAASGICLLGWQAYDILTHADVFQITGIDVRGVKELRDGDLKAIVGPFTGQNIFKVDLHEAVRRANANPWISEVRIHRRLPNRITMDLVERVPFAVLETVGGRFLIDRESIVIEKAAAAPDRPLPLIVVRDYHPRPGEAVTLEIMGEALTLLGEIEARGGWTLAEVTVKAGSSETMSVVYADHEFKIGSGRYGEKLRRLGEIMSDVKQRNLSIAYVDLRAEGQAAVMVRESPDGKNAPGARHQNNKEHK